MIRKYVFGFIFSLSGSVDCLRSPLFNEANYFINTAGVIAQIKPTIVVTDSFARAIEEAANAYSLSSYHRYSDHPLLSYDVRIIRQERDLSCFSSKCRTRSYLEVVSTSVALSSRRQSSTNFIARDSSKRSRKRK